MRIETDNNWRRVDQLGGVELKDGEWLSIRFPNGAVESHAVKIRHGSYNVGEQGSRDGWPCPIRKAVVVVDVNGQLVDVPIAGLEAERIPESKAVISGDDETEVQQKLLDAGVDPESTFVRHWHGTGMLREFPDGGEKDGGK